MNRGDNLDGKRQLERIGLREYLSPKQQAVGNAWSGPSVCRGVDVVIEMQLVDNRLSSGETRIAHEVGIRPSARLQSAIFNDQTFSKQRDDIRKLLRGEVRLVVAKSAIHSAGSMRASSSTSGNMIQPRLVEPATAEVGSSLDDYPGGLAYLASEWRNADDAAVIVV